MTTQDLKFSGFPSWMDLIKFIKRNELEQWEAVRIPKKVLDQLIEPINIEKMEDDEFWILKIDEIKARAFDEIFAALPMADSVRVIKEELIEQRPEINHIMSFLSKLPTRDL